MPLTFLQLKDISERFMELINPTSPEKLLHISRLAGMEPGKRVIDFGCGFAEGLVLWSENFGVSGVGMDVRPNAIVRAEAKIRERGLSDRLSVTQAMGAEYAFEPGSFDFATCIGASFIWDSLPEALQALKRAIRPGGKIILGEAYWLKDSVPPDFAQSQPGIRSQRWLLQTFRQAELEMIYALHSNGDEWDRYISSDWYGLWRWAEENMDHPDRPQVLEHLHESQEEYFNFGHEYFGWALYLLSPMQSE